VESSGYRPFVTTLLQYIVCHGLSSVSENGSEPPPAAQHRHTSKAAAKLQAALDYLTDINVASQNRSDKWVINESILFSLTGCYGQIEARLVVILSEIDGFL
jgi:hypothetical protein